MVTVSELVTILDQYHSTDQVLGFKVIVKRNYSTSIQQSHNWPKLDDVSPQTSEQGESPANRGVTGGGHSTRNKSSTPVYSGQCVHGVPIGRGCKVCGTGLYC